MRVAELTGFMQRREWLRKNKEAGKPRPWTKDHILDTYRFCNVHREDDKVTRWISEHWRGPYCSHPDLWFLMVFARLFNLPRTLAFIGAADILAWKPEKVRLKLHLARTDSPIFNGAYIVSTNGTTGDKVDYLIARVLGPLWANRAKLRPRLGETLASYHARLMQYDGLGTFMAAQVVADLKYVAPLRDASDWSSWAAKGPGSRRGLNRVCGRAVDASWLGDSWLIALQGLHAAVIKRGWDIHAQDLQNCLCEFDKYERVRLGEGTPKQIYREKTVA